MHCLASMRPKRARRNLRGSSLLKSSPAQFSGLLHQSPPPILLSTRRAVHQNVPRTQRTPLIHSTHTSLGTGHPGVNTTLSLLRDRFWWPNMARDVRRFVQGCPDCAISRSTRHLPAGKLHPLPIPNRPWSHLGVDFITDLPVSDGYTCILVIIDRFSKFCRLTPLTGLSTALQMAELLFNRVFRYYGIPEDIVSDRGPQFISRVWKAFFSILGVTVSLTSGYHPQSNGQTQRKIQEVRRVLRTFCHGHQNSWKQFLGWAEYAQNSLRQISTGFTPFQCVLGFQPPLFPWSGERSDIPAVDYWFRESESLGRSPPSAAAGSAQAKNHGRRPSISHTRIPAGAKGVAIYSGHQTAPALPETQSQICWPLHHLGTNQSSHLQTPTASSVQDSPHIPCVTT